MSETTERRECPDCGKGVAVTRSGALRRHQCEAEQAAVRSDSDGTPTGIQRESDRTGQRPTVAGRPKCYVDACEVPEFMDNVGLCGGHWATRPDLRKVARHG